MKVSFLARERDLSYRATSYRDRDRDRDRVRDRDRDRVRDRDRTVIMAVP
jgi:hypothetical protein